MVSLLTATLVGCGAPPAPVPGPITTLPTTQAGPSAPAPVPPVVSFSDGLQAVSGDLTNALAAVSAAQSGVVIQTLTTAKARLDAIPAGTLSQAQSDRLSSLRQKFATVISDLQSNEPNFTERANLQIQQLQDAVTLVQSTP